MINYAHVDALMRASDGPVKHITGSGTVMVSNGHFLVEYSGTMDISKVKPNEQCPKLWMAAVDAYGKDPELFKPTQLHIDKGREYPRYYRRVGVRLIDERYLRIFPDDARFFASAPTSPVVAVREGRVIGLVMPLTDTYDMPYAAEPISDEDVFRPSACQENGFYLQSKGELYATRKALRDELRSLREEFGDAKERMEELADDIDAIEKKLGAMDDAE